MSEANVSQPVYRARLSRIPSPAERAAELQRFERQSDRDRFRDLIRTSVECIAWCVAGLTCLGWSFHTNDQGWGLIAFYGGLVIGNSGILVSLYCANLRAIERGDIV
jgi:hypothetical protein